MVDFDWGSLGIDADTSGWGWGGAWQEPSLDSVVSAAVSAGQTIAPRNTTASTTGDFLAPIFGGVNYALATYDRITAANDRKTDAQLKNYVVRANYDMAKDKISAEADINRMNAQTSRQLATARSNLATQGASLANLGQRPDSLMLILTLLGVAFAGIQLVRMK